MHRSLVEVKHELNSSTCFKVPLSTNVNDCQTKADLAKLHHRATHCCFDEGQLVTLKPRSPTVFYTVYKRAVRGAVASWLVLSTPERAVRVRALAGDIASVVFLGKTLYSHSSSLHPLVQMGTGKLLGKSDKLRGSDLRWTRIPSRGSRNTSSRFML